VTALRRSTDVVVVGGGPSGSFSALAAAKRGAEVLVLEEHAEIGKPSHCAGHISIHGLKTLGIEIPDNLIENRIRMAKFHSPRGMEICIDCKRPVTYVIDRALFDQYLADLAAQAGASFLKGVSANSLLAGLGRIQGVVTGGREESRIATKVVIDAEGAAAGLLRRSHFLDSKEQAMVTGVQGYASKIFSVAPDSVEIYLGNDYAPGFFAWIIPTLDGGAKVGLATNKGNPRTLLERFCAKHPVASKKIRGPLSDVSFHPIPIGGPPSRTYGDGLVVVGDAASQVKPTTGGGVIFGMICARFAGETAAEAIETGDCSSAFLSRYQSLWEEELGNEFRVGKLTRSMLNGLGDKKVDRIFSIGRWFHIEDSLKEISEIDFEDRILRSSLRKPNVALAVGCAILSSLLP
jgi:digeranylgeranylglycerophospholipid reductase